MGRGLLLLLASMLVIPAPTFGQEPAPQVPSFRAGVELVSVTATVRDKKGRLVKGLNAADFEVLDSGQRRAITNFRTDPSPVSIALLV